MSKMITAPDVIEAEASLGENKTLGEAPPAVRLAKRTRRRSVSRKAPRSRKQRHAAAAGSKQNFVLQMLRRQSGVSIDDIASKTDWQPHSVRGFLSGVVRKKLNLRLVSEAGKDGVRRYHVTSLKPAKA